MVDNLNKDMRLDEYTLIWNLDHNIPINSIRNID